jgi:hypothetical protein
VPGLATKAIRSYGWAVLMKSRGSCEWVVIYMMQVELVEIVIESSSALIPVLG